MKKNTIKTTAISIVAVFVMTVAAFAQNNGYQVDDLATDFTLKNVDGKMVSLSDYKSAKGYIVIFSCNTCPYVVAYEDRMIDLHNKYNKKGFPVIAINPNDPELSPGDSFENMQKRAKEKQFPFAYVFDEKQEVFPKYGATRTPHVYLLEKTDRGNIVRYIGAIDDNFKDATAVNDKFLENAVDALLAGEEITETTTRAIGCTIKVKSK
ncbi:MAG TPA: thioredoxin family protein [Flavobacteriaceae bacterium]|nr:thioredoxin family protein [Flavobacteriaceae bacterium]